MGLILSYRLPGTKEESAHPEGVSVREPMNPSEAHTPGNKTLAGYHVSDDRFSAIRSSSCGKAWEKGLSDLYLIRSCYFKAVD